MGKVILVSYAGATDPGLNSRLVAAQKVLIESAPTGGVDEVISWDRGRLTATGFYLENRDILDRKRGGGYWLWKPYIILDALRGAGKDDVVIYWDAGRVNPNRFTRPVTPLLRWCREHNGIFPGVPIFPHVRWTKRDCFHLMGCDSEKYWKSRQIQATFSLWCGDRAVEFVEQWLHWCRDRRCLTDDANECGLPNDPRFNEHRHDQSILTNLCVMHGVATPPTPDIPPGMWTKNLNLWSELLEARFVHTEITEEQTWRIILAHAPRQPFALHRLGLTCLHSGRLPEALELLGGASENLPMSGRFQRDYAAALERAGRLGPALQRLQLASSLPDLQDGPSLFVAIGDLAAKLQDSTRAEVAYRQALIADANHALAWSRLADLLGSQSRHDEESNAHGRARRSRADGVARGANPLEAAQH